MSVAATRDPVLRPGRSARGPADWIGADWRSLGNPARRLNLPKKLIAANGFQVAEACVERNRFISGNVASVLAASTGDPDTPRQHRSHLGDQYDSAVTNVEVRA